VLPFALLLALLLALVFKTRKGSSGDGLATSDELGNLSARIGSLLNSKRKL
jgi:hypothetical protein